MGRWRTAVTYDNARPALTVSNLAVLASAYAAKAEPIAFVSW